MCACACAHVHLCVFAYTPLDSRLPSTLPLFSGPKECRGAGAAAMLGKEALCSEGPASWLGPIWGLEKVWGVINMGPAPQPQSWFTEKKRVPWCLAHSSPFWLCHSPVADPATPAHQAGVIRPAEGLNR